MLYFRKNKNLRSFILVSVQFICLILIFVTGPLYPKNPVLLIFYGSGFAIGLWAIYSMNSETINVPPDVRPNATLSKKGPYALIRHPMYLSLLLVSVPLVFSKPTLFRIVVETTLLIDLLIKLNIEEKMLIKDLAGYKDYKKYTWRIIPFIY